MLKLYSEGQETLKTEISCLVDWKIMRGALGPHDTP